MNFKEWEVKVEFTQDVFDFYKNKPSPNYMKWADGLEVFINRLVSECEYLPRIGEWIDGGEAIDGELEFDGLYVWDLSFFQRGYMVFYMSYKDRFGQADVF
jgi:hypothetical protein